MPFAGELAAVGTALCWGSSAAFFVTSGRRMGSLVLNRIRLTAAFPILALLLWIFRGSPWPSWATERELYLLGASSFLGFVLGDALYFRALVILGAGRAALLLSLTPLLTAVQARWFLGEKLGPFAIAGMALTLGGLAVVLRERVHALERHPEGSPFVGVLCGIGASLFISTGYVLTRTAMQSGLDPLSGTVARLGISLPIVWLLAPLQGGMAATAAAIRDRVAMRAMLGGALLGPCAGVTLSLVALQHAPAAIASSIFACFPLVALYLGARIHHERLGRTALVGALVAVGGVFLLFVHG